MPNETEDFEESAAKSHTHNTYSSQSPHYSVVSLNNFTIAEDFSIQQPSGSDTDQLMPLYRTAHYESIV
jgi:hypothetical protein